MDDQLRPRQSAFGGRILIKPIGSDSEENGPGWKPGLTVRVNPSPYLAEKANRMIRVRMLRTIVPNSRIKQLADGRHQEESACGRNDNLFPGRLRQRRGQGTGRGVFV
jgi:hypothetical protein